MIKHTSINVTTTAASLITLADKFGHASGEASVTRSVLLSNEGSVDVLVGGSGVTSTAYGAKLKAGTSLAFDLGAGDVLFGITPTGTATVRALHVGV